MSKFMGRARNPQGNVPHPVLTVQRHVNPNHPNGAAALCAVAHQCHLSPTTQTLPYIAQPIFSPKRQQKQLYLAERAPSISGAAAQASATAAHLPVLHPPRRGGTALPGLRARGSLARWWCSGVQQRPGRRPGAGSGRVAQEPATPTEAGLRCAGCWTGQRARRRRQCRPGQNCSGAAPAALPLRRPARAGACLVDPS